MRRAEFKQVVKGMPEIKRQIGLLCPLKEVPDQEILEVDGVENNAQSIVTEKQERAIQNETEIAGVNLDDTQQLEMGQLSIEN